MTHPDVLVLGGGIIGLTAARELALRKLRVEVVERQPEGEDGAEASLAAGGMLSPVNPDTLPGPFADVALASRDLWPGLVATLESDTGIQLDFDRSGALLVAVEDGDLDFVTQMEAAARGVGETVEEIDFAELHRLVPDLAPDVRRALLLRGEYRVDNVRVIAALRRELAGHGVVLHPSSEAQRIEIRQPEGTVLVSGHHWRKESGFVVVAAGAWSGRIEGLPPLPIRPVRGQMLRLEGARWPFGGSVRCGDSYGVRRGPAGLVVGSTAEEAGFAKHNTVDGIETLLAKVRRLFPGLGGAHLDRIWAGLRPAAPDGLPIIGWLPGLPVLVATAHFRNGILLAPWTAQHLVDLAVSGDRRREVPAFSPSRFFGGR